MANFLFKNPLRSGSLISLIQSAIEFSDRRISLGFRCKYVRECMWSSALSSTEERERERDRLSWYRCRAADRQWAWPLPVGRSSVGVVYTRITLSKLKHSIFSVCSSYHNLTTKLIAWQMRSIIVYWTCASINLVYGKMHRLFPIYYYYPQPWYH